MKRLRQPRHSAFTLVEIMIVVAIIGLIVAIAIPNFMRTRQFAAKQICFENLTQIESAKQLWGVERGKKDGDLVTEDDLIGPTLYIRNLPECPGGGTYVFGAIGTNATCSTEGHSLSEPP